MIEHMFEYENADDLIGEIEDCGRKESMIVGQRLSAAADSWRRQTTVLMTFEGQHNQ